MLAEKTSDVIHLRVLLVSIGRIPHKAQWNNLLSILFSTMIFSKSLKESSKRVTMVTGPSGRLDSKD